MLFNSLEFLFFFPIVTIIYFLLPFKYRWLHLLTASCIFYAAFIPVYILILFFTIIIDYLAGIYIEKSVGKTRKLYLIISLISNIGILAVFKYYNFFIDNFNTFFTSINSHYEPLPYLSIILPIGLSFHTFQAMSYTIEVYRKNQVAERHFGIYSLYVMYYPQLVAGPIERPQNIIHQLKEEHFFDRAKTVSGLRLMLWGMFKKVVIADNLGLVTDAMFNAPHQYQGITIIIPIIFFAFQIYCDFSGYSDIAIGSSRIMGIELMQNFRQPYFSTSISEFWRRWHISLSTWFKDYLYIPLGGNRVPRMRAYLNLLIVFVISGLWHGASWTFIIWGALHGLFLILEQVLFPSLKKSPKASSSLFRKLPAMLFTFCLVSFAWVFFRANSFQDAIHIISNATSGISFTGLSSQLASLGTDLKTIVILFGLIAFLLIAERTDTIMGFDSWMSKRPQALRWTVYYMLIALIIMKGSWGEQQFIYFQF